MRLWSFQLLPFLDDFHIVAQWRELLAIKGAIDKNGTPNHRLVNKVLDYDIKDFIEYTSLVCYELNRRHIKYLDSKWQRYYLGIAHTLRQRTLVLICMTAGTITAT